MAESRIVQDKESPRSKYNIMNLAHKEGELLTHTIWKHTFFQCFLYGKDDVDQIMNLKKTEEIVMNFTPSPI